MIPVSEALKRFLALASPTGPERVPLAAAAGRVLARPVEARRDQPPFTASAMDGYAVRAADAVPGARLRVIGTAAAGRGLTRPVGPGEAARILTGAPLPPGAERVIIQEDVTRSGEWVVLGDGLSEGSFVRPAGCDFRVGDRIEAPRRLTPFDLALIAAMNQPEVTVARRPRVALVSTGDELVMPGEEPGPDQIIASNAFGLKALLDARGAETAILPIARDTEESVRAALASAEGADLVVTIGGASVGDHDVIARLAPELGVSLDFYKVAMRPGKPLMAGRLGDAIMVGLPGNPVSALVCGVVFLQPLVDAMLGLPAGPLPLLRARLARPLGPNGPREHYMRAAVAAGESGPEITAFARQDSALLSVLAQANALLVRPPHDRARAAGEEVPYLPVAGGDSTAA